MKTQVDVLEALIRMTMGPRGDLAVQEWRQQMLPNLRLKPTAKWLLTDEEYEALVSGFRKDLPLFIAWLTHPDRRFDLRPD